MKHEDKVGLVITYKDIFPDGEDYKEHDIERLILDIPRNAVVYFISHVNLCSFYFQFSEGFQEHILKIWTSQFPDTIKKYIGDLKNIFKASEGKYGFIINSQANLKFIEIVLKVCKQAKSSNITPDQALRLFKAYLLINESIMQEQGDKFSSSDRDTPSLEEVYLNRILPIIVASGDHINIDLKVEIYSQLSKGIYFFHFLTESEKLSSLLKAFLKSKGFQNWEEYLRSLASIIFTFIPTRNDFEVVNELNFPDPSEEALDLAKKLAINRNIESNMTSLKTLDHRDLRMFPLYDKGDDSFYCLSVSFLFNKLFDGLFWELNTISKSPEFDINYLSVIRKEFTEEFLLYSILKKVFDKCFTLSGREQSTFYKKKDGKDIEKTDFYVRHTKHIYLFECKDNSLSSKSKVSQDIKELVPFLDRPKDGVRQLARSIKELNTQPFEFDNFESKGIKMRNVLLQPILIVTDRALKVNGINTILAKELEKELEDVKKWTIQYKELLVISVETLILFQDYFSKDKNNLRENIDKYQEHVKILNKKIVIGTMDHLISKYPSFDSYIIKKQGFTFPKKIESELKFIFG